MEQARRSRAAEKIWRTLETRSKGVLDVLE